MHFLTPRRILILLILLLLVSSFLPGHRADSLASPLRSIVETFATPIRAPLHNLGVAMRPAASQPQQPHEPADPGQVLRRIAQLELDVESLLRENRQLRRVRDIVGEQAPLVLVDARITAVTGPPNSPLLRIDHGSRQHIAPGDIVVFDYHLVGEVASVDPMTSQVQPITTHGAKLLARLMPNDGSAQLRPGSGVWLEWDVDQQAFVQDKMPIATAAQVGDFALLADEGWLPKAQGCFIGQVTSVRDDPMDPYSFKQLIVRPSFQPQHLRRVTVLVEE
ncbi:MAG: hypothetical protein IT445_14240 [Phycisphaeraceae bacterium]|nr:hypothetical protein [Phycisphaeraceae bacterium]